MWQTGNTPRFRYLSRWVEVVRARSREIRLGANLQKVSAVPAGISIREFARRAGCNEKVVRRKVQSGHLPAFPDGSVDPSYVDLDWRSGIEMRTAGADTADTSGINAGSMILPGESPEEAAERIINVGGRVLVSKAEAERIKDNYIALMRQLEFEREDFRLVPIEDVVEQVIAEYQLVKNKLIGLGARIAPRAAVMRSAEEVKALIDREVHSALEELAFDGNPNGDIVKAEASIKRRLKKPK